MYGPLRPYLRSALDCASNEDGFVVAVSSYVAMSVALRFDFGRLKASSETVSYAEK